jgi:hypothetical protein
VRVVVCFVENCLRMDFFRTDVPFGLVGHYT